MWPTLTEKEQTLFKMAKSGTNTLIVVLKWNILIPWNIKDTNVLTWVPVRYRTWFIAWR